MFKAIYYYFFPKPAPIIPYFLKDGIIFGSYRWGGFTYKSDIDILVNTDLFTTIFEFLKNSNIEYNYKQDPYNFAYGCLEFTFDDYTYQVLKSSALERYSHLFNIADLLAAKFPNDFKTKQQRKDILTGLNYYKDSPHHYKTRLPSGHYEYLQEVAPELFI